MLPAAAAEFYRVLARRPVVGGTAQAERFVVHRTADSVTVTIFAAGLSTDSLLFRRTFWPAETSRITLDGLQGNDIFEVQTTAEHRAGRMQLHLVGGTGTDLVRPVGPTRRIIYYDEAAVGPSKVSPHGEPATLKPQPLPRSHRPYERLTDD